MLLNFQNNPLKYFSLQVDTAMSDSLDSSPQWSDINASLFSSDFGQVPKKIFCRWGWGAGRLQWSWDWFWLEQGQTWHYRHFGLDHFFKDFMYLLEKERAYTQAGRGRGRSRLPTEQGAWCGAQSQGPGIMTWAERRRLTNWATQTPSDHHFLL